jgi:hypothetical protein
MKPRRPALAALGEIEYLFAPLLRVREIFLFLPILIATSLTFQVNARTSNEPFSKVAVRTPSVPTFNVHFERDQYFISPEENTPVTVVIDPVPNGGLASFGVLLSFDPESASVVGVGGIEVNPELSFDGPRSDTPVVSVGRGVAGTKGTLRFQPGSIKASTNRVLVTFLIRDLGKGPHRLQLSFFNTIGPTEQIFVDGSGGVIDSQIVFGSAEVIPTGGLEIEAAGPISLNRQTGLFEQIIHLLNRRQFPIIGATILVKNLPQNWQVWNATGTNSGNPYLRVNSSIAGGASLPVRVEFRVPNRNPVERPAYSISDYTPGSTSEPPGESFLVLPKSNLPDGSFLLEFSTLSNRFYSVQYSRDLMNWTTVSPSQKGNGSRSQWIDYGPPKTESSPSQETNRFYRVILLP